ncbi:MAG: hypothetical protein ACLSHP_08750 [Coprococcus sp.]
MNLTVNREGKYAIVWMTNAEKADPKVMDSLQPLIAECKEKKYRLVMHCRFVQMRSYRKCFRLSGGQRLYQWSLFCFL